MNRMTTLVVVSLAAFNINHYPSVTWTGSTIVYPYKNTSLPELELGASIFVKANKNLWRASDEFNLTRSNFTDENYDLGIWDGEKILISVCLFDKNRTFPAHV